MLIWERDEKEFEALFQTFVREGDPDPRRCATEEWERSFRQTACCTHGIPKQRCQACRTAVPVYHASPYYGQA